MEDFLYILCFSVVTQLIYFNVISKTKSIKEYLIDQFLITFCISYLYCIISIFKSIYSSISINKYIKIKKTDSSLPLRMKVYEKLSKKITKINNYDNFIIKINGKSFSNLTNYFKKPFDENFTEIMLKTSNNLLNIFCPTLIHVQNDEISMVFNKEGLHKDCYFKPKNKQHHIFGGKIKTLISISSSFVGSKFYHNLGTFVNNLPINDTNYSRLLSDYNLGNLKIGFDSKVIIIPENKQHEITNYMLWRSPYDGFRNTVTTYYRNLLPNEQFGNLTTIDYINKMKELNINFDEEPNHVKFGWFVKNMSINKTNKTPIAISLKLTHKSNIKEQLLKNRLNLSKLKMLNDNIETRNL